MLGDRPVWFDIEGQPITEARAFELKYGPDGKLSNYARIGSDEVDGQTVSTVWLAMNHEFLPGRPPLLFETMIFGGEHDGLCDRYTTKEQARAGHAATVAALRAGKVPAWIDGNGDE